jgi:hypothetical protein
MPLKGHTVLSRLARYLSDAIHLFRVNQLQKTDSATQIQVYDAKKQAQLWRLKNL